MEQMSPMLQARIAQQQEINNSNQKNNTQHVDLAQKPDTFESSTKKEDENKKGKIAKIIAIGAVVAAAIAGIVYAVKKGKTINLKDMTPDKFKQIQAEEFTGKIKGKLKNGDKVVMEYVDGVLKKSTRSGEVNFEKVYETINNEKIVKKTVNGVTTEFNITKTQKEVQSAQEKLESLLKNDKLSSDELKKQTDAIKFKSNNQKKEIENTINAKKKAEADLKAKVEAKQKAQKAAKEKAEKEAKERAIKEAEQKAQKLKQQQIQEMEAQFERQVTNFKTSIANKSDDEIVQISQQVQKEHDDLWQKAQKLADEKGIKSGRQLDILETLTEEERQEYRLLQSKVSALSSEKTIREYNYLDGILRKPEDKPLKTMHSAEYGTEAERDQLLRYYDDYQCNSAYRGQGGSINVKEELMDSLFKKAPALEEDAVVYRSVNALSSKNQPFIDSLKDGFVIDNPGYTSTATIVKDSQFYQFTSDVVSKNTDGVLMRIHLPKGTKGVLGGHNEYLLPRNSKIKINKINLIDGIKVADCEYILPN